MTRYGVLLKPWLEPLDRLSRFYLLYFVDLKDDGTSALTAVMSPLSAVGELIILGLSYTKYPGRFGECFLKHNYFWMTVLDGG